MLSLVTGGGGFLGGAVVRALRARGQSVRTFSRSRYSFLDEIGAEQHVGDLVDADAVAKAIEGCECVYHVAARAGVWGYYGDYYRANVIGTRNVLAGCRQQGVRKLIFTSSPSVIYDGSDQNGVSESVPYPASFEANYPLTKAMAEREALAANGPELAVVSLRPHLIWGPGDPHLVPRLVERARRGKLRRVGNESKLVDTIYVDNAAAAHLLAGDRLAIGSPIAGKAYFLSQGEPMPLWDFVNRVLAVAKLPPVERTVSFGLAYFAGSVLEVLYPLLRLRREPPMTRFVARQLATAHWFNVDAARRDLGYEPTISTEEGLRRIAECPW